MKKIISIIITIVIIDMAVFTSCKKEAIATQDSLSLTTSSISGTPKKQSYSTWFDLPYYNSCNNEYIRVTGWLTTTIQATGNNHYNYTFTADLLGLGLITNTIYKVSLIEFNKQISNQNTWLGFEKFKLSSPSGYAAEVRFKQLLTFNEDGTTDIQFSELSVSATCK